MRSERFKESLLQWIWGNLEFDCHSLHVQSGESLQIIDPGRQNHGAGPDFLHACILLDGIKLFGHIEVHNSTQEWKRHGHHRDENYNSVILHVVLEASGESAKTEDGYRPATLSLKRYLTGSLYHLLRNKQRDGLPCGKNISVIHQKAFEKQIEIAHREYFNYKVDELMAGYNPHLPPSEAWLHSLIRNIYGTLGIPANRIAMEKLFDDLRDAAKPGMDAEEFAGKVTRTAFSESGEKRYTWRRSGMRPGSLPGKRVRQASFLHVAASRFGIKKFLNEGAESWGSLLRNVEKKDLPGKSRLGIIEYTVFLPAIYLLGDLFRKEALCSQAYRIWENSTYIPPGEVSRPFLKSGYHIPSSIKKLGLAHQYKRFCKEGNCHKCEVFKSAINS